MSSNDFYDETLRPQFHFTPKTNWMNDPNKVGPELLGPCRQF